MASKIVRSQLVSVVITKEFDTPRSPSRVGVNGRVISATNDIDRAEGQSLEWHKVNQAQLTAFGDKEELSQYKPGTIVSAVLMEDSNGVLSFKKGTTKAHPKKEEEKPLQLALPF